MRPCAGVLWVTRAGPIGTRCCPPWRGSSLLAWAIRASFGTSPASVARRRSLGTLDARAIVANLRALHAMARPGLEPGTPRFSGSRPVACLHTKGLQIRLSLAVMPRRDPVTFGRFGARLGLRGGVEVPAAEAHRGNRERSICGVCDARVPEATRRYVVNVWGGVRERLEPGQVGAQPGPVGLGGGRVAGGRRRVAAAPRPVRAARDS
jgi:hypothetical protein